jgi:cytochrome c7-like protein
MPQTFPPSMNTVARASLAGIVLLVMVVSWGLWEIENSSYTTEAGLVREQPVPFSHRHHVGGLGLDCRYCHTSVSESSFAGVPPTKTCMTCHSQIWTGAPMLEPVRESWRTARPIAWRRVNNVPGYAYFSHDIHIAKGVGCTTCHGQVNEMPLMRQAASLQMSWCLNCHRQPERYLRPREEVFSVSYTPPPRDEDQLKLGRELAERYHVQPERLLTNCSTCHR